MWTHKQVLAGLLLANMAIGETPPLWQVLNSLVENSIEAKDYAKLRDALIALQPLMPGNPRVAYRLAVTAAKLGDPNTAIAGLRNLAATGLVFDIAADDDFTSIRDTKEFHEIAKHFNANKNPTARGTLAYTLAPKDLIPEDIAYDPKNKRFFISSVRRGEILDRTGKLFAKAPWSVFALAIDAPRRVLWATIAWIPHCDQCANGEDGDTALLAYDLDSGALKQRIVSPSKGLLGDMIISRHGDLYISEGRNGAVFRLPQGASSMQRLDPPREFPSPQTPALSADEKTLYVPDYARGIAAINLSTRAVRWLQPAATIALSGIDGFYLYRDFFLALQNGTTPPRLIRFSVDLRKQQILEANHPALGEPTHGVIVGNDFYFLANTGWGEYEESGKKKSGTAPVESSIRVIPLNGLTKFWN